MFFGRRDELALLSEKYLSKKSELVVIYGRRHIGKTTLIKKFLEKKTYVFSYEGIETGQSDYQIERFSEMMLAHAKDRFTDSSSFKNWDKVFLYLTEKIVVC
ncbi:MAG: ATP-binding protein [Thermodesulfobacteriota bacterium]|nr:ATP-binding protein [Thermodesulfobacteriota bacterium]